MHKRNPHASVGVNKINTDKMCTFLCRIRYSYYTYGDDGESPMWQKHSQKRRLYISLALQTQAQHKNYIQSVQSRYTCRRWTSLPLET